MKYPLCFQWDVSALSGWGVYGLNLLRFWQRASGTLVFCTGTIDIASLSSMDILRRRALLPAAAMSEQLRAHFAATGGQHFNGAVLYGLGNRFGETLEELSLKGLANFGVTFFENTTLPGAAQACGKFALVITGSSWCEQILRSEGATNIATVIQGVDTAQFHPAPRWGAFAGRFAIFSGGKLEYRKGQDLVMQAFRLFAARHPEAVLVTAWHSPWPALAGTVNVNPNVAPMVFQPDGAIDVVGWAQANGLAADQVIDVGSVPNHLMPAVLREMDVGLFPNRCEGGTNLVAMETMACGVPVILSDNTGHKDLTATGTTYALTRQNPIGSFAGMGTREWGESDVEEIVETLEKVWSDRRGATARGLAGAASMTHWSWENQITRLAQTMSPF